MLSQISSELKISVKQVDSVADLLAKGNTVPFIARYRKEVTGSLDEVKIRAIEEKIAYLRDLDLRKKTILESIESQGKLTDSLRKQISDCDNKSKLEDLYLPYKPKRRTRAMIAKEKGLEPLALLILQQPTQGTPELAALPYISDTSGVADAKSALLGARDIIAEIVAETPEIRAKVRATLEESGKIVSGKREEISEPTKFEQYYSFSEKISQIPSHRFLAIARGERENVLKVSFDCDFSSCLDFAKIHLKHNPNSSFRNELEDAISDAFKRLLLPSIETEIRVALKMKADRGAIEVFAENLRNILMFSPMGPKTVIGIDPGLRTGCKCAVVSETSRFEDNITIYLTGSNDTLEKSKLMFLQLVKKHTPSAIAIGNGTGGRETEAIVKSWLRDENLTKIVVVSVSESGASVYSASEVARKEFPELDLTIRGAISIARRLQDPLAELVKVEPKAMGVGQYQHDVFQPLLDKKLSEVVESCVNKVGVDLNTASASLLSYVAGIGENVAKNIVTHREQNGFFKSRFDLKKVAGLGPRTFEQSAGFLRINGFQNPLDASAVHPERYEIVEKIAHDLGVKSGNLVGNESLAKNIDIEKYVNDSIGRETLRDIVDELKKPGRDPRSAFETLEFAEGVNSITDLKKGMVLNGIVTNVTAFGAFVDVGVHQDGLVHVSELSDRFVSDPASVVSAGDRLKVEILDVDIVRKRISMTARVGKGSKANAQPSAGPKPVQKKSDRVSLGSLDAFSKLGKNFSAR